MVKWVSGRQPASTWKVCRPQKQAGVLPPLCCERAGSGRVFVTKTPESGKRLLGKYHTLVEGLQATSIMTVVPRWLCPLLSCGWTQPANWIYFCSPQLPFFCCFFNQFLAVLVFTAVCRLSLVEAALHCGAWASHCGGPSCCRAHTLAAGAAVVSACGLSCSEASGIFPSQGSNPRPLHWQVDSHLLHHQGSP